MLLAGLAALLLLGGVVPRSGVAQPAVPPDTTAPDPPAVDRLIAEALESNLALRQEEISLTRTRRALAEARGRYLPSLDVQARYSRASGGRTIDFPVGDLLNPVYATLNDLTGSDEFPQVQNQEIAFLREREQETQFQVRQPIFDPRIVYGVRAQRRQVDAQQAAVETVRRELARDVRVAFYRYQQADRRVAILEAALEQVTEVERTTTRLASADRTTQDAVFRAEAEVLDVRQQIAEAEAARNRARRYVNFLRNAPLETPLPTPSDPPSARVEMRLQEVAGGLSQAPDAAPDTAGTSALRRTALRRRPELDRLDAAASAADQQANVARSAFVPTVALAVDAGIQGETYQLDGDGPFVLGSVVLRWNLFNGFQDRARLSQARLDARRFRVQRQELARQIEQQVLDAVEAVQVAERSLHTATARRKAAEESYRRTALRYDAGQVALVSLTDARTTLTSARLNQNVTRYDLLIRLAELTFAAGPH